MAKRLYNNCHGCGRWGKWYPFALGRHERFTCLCPRCRHRLTRKGSIFGYERGVVVLSGKRIEQFLATGGLQLPAVKRTG